MSFRSFSVISVALLLLASCASNTVKQTKPVEDKPNKQLPVEVTSSSDFLNQARLNKDVFQRNDLLLQAAQAFQTEQQCSKSIKMLNVLIPELLDNRQLTLASLLLAECYLLLPDQRFDLVEQILTKLKFDYGYQARIEALNAEIQIHNKQWLKAAIALQKTQIDDAQKSTNIWAWVKKLDRAELEEAVLREPSLQPWLQLALISKRHGITPLKFEQEILAWQTRHLNHPLVTSLPTDIQLLLQQSLITPQKIAILLPLSGRLANQGLAIKEGIVAAYLDGLAENNSSTNEFNPMQEIRFFDSALKSAQEINVLVAEFDVIVGPLLKDKISALRKILPKEKILLALNRIDTLFNPIDVSPSLDSLPEENIAATHFYFSLAPEDEAEQLAEYISKKQLVRPIIFAANNATTQRMAQAFLKKWRATPNAIEPDLTIFTDNKDMRTRVAEMLDVAQSQDRITQIERIANVEVIGVARNRRDIDAIVLFANPEQTELLNPIIEASLSPFAKKSLSVFASSRSYSLDLNSNNMRDLRNLTFTDMPWMLPAHAWQDLAEQTKQLWPQRQDTLLRLFALGYDAYKLLPYLNRLKTSTLLKNKGLTGELSVDQDGVIHRILPWAKITQDQVQIIAMD